MTCPECKNAEMRVRMNRGNGSLFIACSGYPNCKKTMTLPKGIEDMEMTEQNCRKCKGVRKF
jgi:ssDNA-binding Zn-finger/Zn-ribbon topoisomerase 1